MQFFLFGVISEVDARHRSRERLLSISGEEE